MAMTTFWLKGFGNAQKTNKETAKNMNGSALPMGGPLCQSRPKDWPTCTNRLNLFLLLVGARFLVQRLSCFLIFLLNQTASPKLVLDIYCHGANIGRNCDNSAPLLMIQIEVGWQLEINFHNQLRASPACLLSVTVWLLCLWLLKRDLSYLQRPYFYPAQDCDAYFLWQSHFFEQNKWLAGKFCAG